MTSRSKPRTRPALALLVALLALLVAVLALPALAAAAPDLFAEPPAAARRSSVLALAPATRRERAVNVDTALLAGPRINLNLFAGTGAEAVRERLVRRRDGGYSWFGRIAGDPLGSAVMVVKNGRVTADFTVHGRLYQLRPGRDGAPSLLRDIDQSAFPPEGCDDLPATPAAADIPAAPAPAATAQDSGAFIDVLVVYTQTTAAASTDIGAEIQLAVDETNMSYGHSHIAPRLRLAGTLEVDYAETGDLTTDLPRLAYPADGYLDQVQAERDRVGADVVVLIVENGGAYCGLAATIRASQAYAYCVVDRSCATGYYSFGHEIGHLQGARHDTAVDTAMSPFAYGHGYVYPAARWRTVMAYDKACTDQGFSCSRLPYWSDPDTAYLTIPMGSASLQDNSRVLNETATDVANFRKSTIATDLTPILGLLL